jgi:drug/metabolite transporter (DMT)-like permease
MDYFRRLEPTPDALRHGRWTFAAVAVIYGVIIALMVFLPSFADTVMVTIMVASLVTLLGTGLSYLGQPTLTRYRAGLIVTAVGVVVSFWMLIANPFVSASG